jgi:hypothetical protein
MTLWELKMLVQPFPHAPDPEPECLARATYLLGPFCKVCGHRWEAHKKSNAIHQQLTGRAVRLY